MNSEIEDRLKEIKIENFIWLIYLGIIGLSYYSNYLEKDYFINNNIKSKEKYREILIVIFSILLVVYIYFFYDSYSSLKDLEKYSKEKQKKIVLSFLGSTFILLSGIIFLYLAYIDNDLDVELAFN